MTEKQKEQFEESSELSLLIDSAKVKETLANLRKAMIVYAKAKAVRLHIYQYERECETIMQGLETIQDQLTDLIAKSKEWESL